MVKSQLHVHLSLHRPAKTPVPNFRVPVTYGAALPYPMEWELQRYINPPLFFTKTPLSSASKNIINHHTQQPLLYNGANSKQPKMSQRTIHDNNNCFNNTNSFNNVWKNYTVANDRSSLLTWLSPLEPKVRHRDIQG